MSGRESHRCPAGVRARAMHGVSLIELMIGIAIGLMLVAIVLRGFATSTGNAAVNSLVSEYQTNGRHALEVLKREVRHAALSPLVWETGQVEVNAAVAARDFGCGAGVSTDVVEGIRASNDSNPHAASCLAAAADRSYARGDVLTLRRLGLSPVTLHAANAPYARVSYGQGNVFLGGEAALPLPPPTFDYPIVNDVYFINEFTTSATESPKVPALYRLTLTAGANPTLAPELVASNVEQMQWQFGIVDTVGHVRYLNPDAVAAADWPKVVTARVWLLLRASMPEAGFVSGTYQMGNLDFAPGDSYRRVVLSSTIQLRNH